MVQFAMKEHRRTVNGWLKRCLMRNFTPQEASLCPDTSTGRKQQGEEALWNKFIESVNKRSGTIVLDTTGRSACSYFILTLVVTGGISGVCF